MPKTTGYYRPGEAGGYADPYPGFGIPRRGDRKGKSFLNRLGKMKLKLAKEQLKQMQQQREQQRLDWRKSRRQPFKGLTGAKKGRGGPSPRDWILASDPNMKGMPGQEEAIWKVNEWLGPERVTRLMAQKGKNWADVIGAASRAAPAAGAATLASQMGGGGRGAGGGEDVSAAVRDWIEPVDPEEFLPKTIGEMGEVLPGTTLGGDVGGVWGSRGGDIISSREMFPQRGFKYGPAPAGGLEEGSLPGTVPATGKTTIHKGEVVIPKKQVTPSLLAMLIEDGQRKGTLRKSYQGGTLRGLYRGGEQFKMLGGQPMGPQVGPVDAPPPAQVGGETGWFGGPTGAPPPAGQPAPPAGDVGGGFGGLPGAPSGWKVESPRPPGLLGDLPGGGGWKAKQVGGPGGVPPPTGGVPTNVPMQNAPMGNAPIQPPAGNVPAGPPAGGMVQPGVGGASTGPPLTSTGLPGPAPPAGPTPRAVPRRTYRYGSLEASDELLNRLGRGYKCGSLRPGYQEGSLEEEDERASWGPFHWPPRMREREEGREWSEFIGSLLGKTVRGTGEAMRGTQEQVGEVMGEMLRGGEEGYYGPEEYTRRQLEPVEKAPSVDEALLEAGATETPAEPVEKVPEKKRTASREELYQKLRGMPEQVQAQHKAKMSEIEAERLLDILRFNRAIDPQVAKSIMDKVAFNMKISDKYSGIARGREKAIEDELKQGAALDRQITYWQEREKATGERMVDVKEMEHFFTMQVKDAESLNKLMMVMHEVATTDKMGSNRQRALQKIASLLVQATQDRPEALTMEEAQEIAPQFIGFNEYQARQFARSITGGK